MTAFEVRPETRVMLGEGEQLLKAHMPGMIVGMRDAADAEAGDSMCWVECMKMEAHIQAPCRMQVVRRLVAVNDMVEAEQPLMIYRAL